MRSLLMFVIACGASASPRAATPSAPVDPPVDPPRLQRDGSSILCASTGTRVGLPADVLAHVRAGTDLLELAEGGRALIAKAGDDRGIAEAVFADWKQLFTRIATVPPSLAIDGELHAKSFAANAVRITGDFAAAGERYRLTAIIVVRNGGSCRVQSLVRAGAAELALDDVTDMPALDLPHPQPESPPDWVVLLRVLDKAFKR